MKKNIFTLLLAVSLVGAASVSTVFASDHDDGISRVKSRNRNLTDLYAFREDNQTGNAADASNLVVVMNSNPRAAEGRQEFFDPSATYEFHFSKIAAANLDVKPTGSEDAVLRFSFSAPDSNGRQSIKAMLVHQQMAGNQQVNNDEEMVSELSSARTTSIWDSKAKKIRVNKFRSKDGPSIEVFAGLRQDPFFFDVDQFFKVRAGAVGKGPKVGFRAANKAVDFAVGYNVNSIVARIPIALLSRGTDSPIFDVWETVSVGGKQVERLARPAINEGLIVTNSYLNAFNMIPPSADLSPAAAPVREEAVKSLMAFDAIDGKKDIAVETVVNAFLPDVMRIDTRVNAPAGTAAYNAATSGSLGMLTGGRKIEDDVMDITLSLLVAGDPTGQKVQDGVSYAGGKARNQGHSLLNGQKARLGVASFPFLATPN